MRNGATHVLGVLMALRLTVTTHPGKGNFALKRAFRFPELPSLASYAC